MSRLIRFRENIRDARQDFLENEPVDICNMNSEESRLYVDIVFGSGTADKYFKIVSKVPWKWSYNLKVKLLCNIWNKESDIPFEKVHGVLYKFSSEINTKTEDLEYVGPAIGE